MQPRWLRDGRPSMGARGGSQHWAAGEHGRGVVRRTPTSRKFEAERVTRSVFVFCARARTHTSSGRLDDPFIGIVAMPVLVAEGAAWTAPAASPADAGALLEQPFPRVCSTPAIFSAAGCAAQASGHTRLSSARSSASSSRTLGSSSRRLIGAFIPRSTSQSSVACECILIPTTLFLQRNPTGSARRWGPSALARCQSTRAEWWWGSFS